MEGERGDTGGRTRTVFVETGLETATFAEALARRDAPTPDIGVPARTITGHQGYLQQCGTQACPDHPQ